MLMCPKRTEALSLLVCDNELLILMAILITSSEYPKASAFYNFLASPEFALFKDKVKHGVTAPPTLKLFETSSGLESVGDDTALGLILLSPKSGNDLAGLLDRVKSLAKPTLGSRAVFGVNLNSGDNEIVVLESFKDQKVSTKTAY